MGRPRIPEKKRLADALKALHKITGDDRSVILGPELKSGDRTLLVEKGGLQEILKGWYFVSDPNAILGYSLGSVHGGAADRTEVVIMNWSPWEIGGGLF